MPSCRAGGFHFEEVRTHRVWPRDGTEAETVQGKLAAVGFTDRVGLSGNKHHVVYAAALADFCRVVRQVLGRDTILSIPYPSPRPAVGLDLVPGIAAGDVKGGSEMATYAPPVSHLVKLGRPEGLPESADYSIHGIGPEHVPELIRLLQDDELAWAESDLPDDYGQAHAWRALGQLRAEAAIEPLLDLLATQEDDKKWIDWITEEVPVVLGLIGPPALPIVAARLEQHRPGQLAVGYYARALTEVALRHPATRDDVIQHLSGLLKTAALNEPDLNGLVIGDLLDLNAVEAWPAIEQAFATDNVETFIAGDADAVKWKLGLGPKPERRRPPVFTTPPNRPPQMEQGHPTAKQRAEDRARQRKAEKRKKRKQRRK